MTAQALGILIVMVTFAGWLRAVWAARPWPAAGQGAGMRHGLVPPIPDREGFLAKRNAMTAEDKAAERARINARLDGCPHRQVTRVSDEWACLDCEQPFLPMVGEWP